MNVDCWSKIFALCDEPTLYSLQKVCKNFSSIKTQKSILLESCRLGYIKLIELQLHCDDLLMKRDFIDEEILYDMKIAAIQGGQLSLFQLLFDRDDDREVKMFEKAVSYNQLEILQWLISLLRGFNNYAPASLMNKALKHGYIGIAEYLLNKGFSLIPWLHYTYAAKSGKIEVLDWLFGKGIQPIEIPDSCSDEVRKWFLTNNFF